MGSPLAEVLGRQDVIDEVRPDRCHPPSSAARTGDARLARQCHGPVDVTVVAAQPDKALVRVAAAGDPFEKSAPVRGQRRAAELGEHGSVAQVIGEQRAQRGHVERLTHPRRESPA